MRKTLRERRYYNASVGRVGVRVFFAQLRFLIFCRCMNVPLLSCEKRRRQEKKAKKKEWREKKRKTGEGKKQRERLKGDEHRVVAVRLLLSQRSDNYGSRAAPRKRHALSFVEPHL